MASPLTTRTQPPALPSFPASLAVAPLLLFDTHTHLASEADFPDAALDAIVAGATERSVRGAIAVSESVDQAARCLDLAARFPRWMHAGAGVHPVHYSLLAGGAAARAIEAEAIGAFIDAHHERLVCVGEVGLDFSPWILQQAADTTRRTQTDSDAAQPGVAASSANWKSSFDAGADAAERAAQTDLFRTQVRLAVRYGLPLNVHSRNASKHAVALLQEEFERVAGGQSGAASAGPAGGSAASAGGSPPVGVLLHAFDGSVSTLRTALRLGCYVSAPSSLQRDTQLSAVLAQLLRESPMVDIDVHLPVEADSPSGSDGASRPAADSDADASSERRLVSVPSLLLRLVLETDSPALHPVKQPPPSASAAPTAAPSLPSSPRPSGSCCAPELNTPSNLYTALLALHALYVDASRARLVAAREAAARKAAAANRPPRQHKGATVTPTAMPPAAAASASPPAASVAVSAAPAPADPADPPLLSLVDLAALLLQNTHRLFPRTRFSAPALLPAAVQ